MGGGLEMMADLYQDSIQLYLRGLILSELFYLQLLHFPILLMDIEHFISPQNQFSFHYDQSNAQQLPCDFYDHQSHEEQPYTQGSVDEVLHIMVTKHGLIDLPMNEIISEAVQTYHIAQDKIGELVKKVRKTKNILKRNRAKGRVCSHERVQIVEKKQFLWDESSTEKDTVMLEKQIKKQRNRISAQISRDRKKNYVTNLEQINKELVQESQSLKLENEKLKKQISQKNQPEQAKPKQNNKFVRLLVFLGFIFLMYILKDVFNLKNTKTASILKIEDCVEAEEDGTNLHEHVDIVEEIRSQITEIEEEDSVKGSPHLLMDGKSMSLKETILKKVGQLKRKTKQLILPGRLAVNLLQAKNMVLL